MKRYTEYSDIVCIRDYDPITRLQNVCNFYATVNAKKISKANSNVFDC